MSGFILAPAFLSTRSPAVAQKYQSVPQTDTPKDTYGLRHARPFYQSQEETHHVRAFTELYIVFPCNRDETNASGVFYFLYVS